MLENVKELLMSVLLRVWDRTYVRNLDSCVRSFVLTYVGLFLRLCVCGNGPTYTGRTWALTRICETLGKRPTLPIFTFFSPVSLLFAILTHLFFIFAPEYHYIHLLIFILASKTSFFINSSKIKNLISSSLFL